MKKLILLLLSIIILSSCEDSTQTIYEYPDAINDIAIDAQGDVWFATTNFGIVHYNGSKWKNYRTSNSAIPSNYISNIDFDSKGNLWAATSGGVVKFDGKNFNTYDRINSPIPDSRIYTLGVDKNDIIWISAYSKGLWSFKDNDWYFNYIEIQVSDILKDTLFHKSISIDNKNNIWLTSILGIFKLDGEFQLAYTINDYNMVDENILNVITDKTENFWVAGTMGAAFKSIDNNWTIFNSASNLLANYDIRSICVDSNNVKWVATLGGGIASYDGTKWTFFNQQNSGLYSNFNRSIAADKNGNIWVGSFGRQVTRFNGTTWKTIDIYDF